MKHAADVILNDARTRSLQPDQRAQMATRKELPAVKAGQVAPWHSEISFRHKRYAAVLRELAKNIGVGHGQRAGSGDQGQRWRPSTR
jgi:iron complex transport system substrate-binding protein